jgi:RNA-directed DNA polymerase
VRFADDFVVLHEDLACVERAREIAAEWLAAMGLELKPSKTRIVHTLRPHEGQPPGFDFLGSTVRQFTVGKTHSGRNPAGQLLGFKTIIRPSTAAQHRHVTDLARVVRQHQQARTADLVPILNRLIRGWANYYSAQVAKDIFGRMDYLLYERLRRWAIRRHPNKTQRWIYSHYWHAIERRNGAAEAIRRRAFAATNGATLTAHADTVIRRYAKVEATRSPFDGDLPYWASRLGRHPELPRSKALLLKRQRGRCNWCGLLFRSLEDVIEVDHIQPRARSGADTLANRQLLHGHCHDAKTARDGLHRRVPTEVPMTRAKQKAAASS